MFTLQIYAKEKTPTDEQQQIVNEKAEDIDKYGTYNPELLGLIVEFGQENQRDEVSYGEESWITMYEYKNSMI